MVIKDYKDGKIINGDCFDVIDRLVSENVKVDSIICDLPYNTTDCKWDCEIDLDIMWEKLNGIVSKGCPIVMFGSQPFTTKLIASNISNFREEVVWLKNKAGSGLFAKQKHIKIHENIIVFCNDGKYTFNPQKWGVEDKEFLTQRKTFKDIDFNNNLYSSMTRQHHKDDGTRNPISVVAYRVPINPAHSKQYKSEIDVRIHETQKPILLMDYLVKTFSNKGDVVLDFTAGSCTLAVACIQNSRKFICIEKDVNNYNNAVTRIDAVYRNARGKLKF